MLRVTCGDHHMLRERHVRVSPLAAAAQLMRSKAGLKQCWSIRTSMHMGRLLSRRIGAEEFHREEVAAGERRRVMAAGPSACVCWVPRAYAGLPSDSQLDRSYALQQVVTGRASAAT